MEQRILKTCLAALTLMGLTAGCGSDDKAPPPALNPNTEEASAKRPWYKLGFFKDPILEGVVIHLLGQAWHQAADAGEVLETLARVDETDDTSWAREWRRTAERLLAVAEESERGGHPLSSSHAYLRAATYFRQALGRNPDPFAPEIRELSQRAVDSFGKYLTLSGSPCEPVRIPYEGTTLPGYFCKSPLAKSPAPVLIYQQGRDGWAEDGHLITDEVMKRGYHVLLFDGPGMGQVIRLQGLPFRPDWENVVTPVVDWTVARPDVDPTRIGLISLSMGGYMGPRAATKEHRLKVLIPNPGVIDWNVTLEGFLTQLDPTLLPLLEKDEAAFNAKMAEHMKTNALVRWGIPDTMWKHGADTPAKLVKEVRRYQLGPAVADIKAHTLVVDAEAEEWGQSKALYDALTSRKDYLMFTAAETAQFHCQPGAGAIFTHRVLEWLERSL